MKNDQLHMLMICLRFNHFRSVRGHITDHNFQVISESSARPTKQI